ncbi:hypothetical protein Tco_0626469 [Tanacetum coccineum]|uniref:Uncharacterized protein n=1 Tax=Tanacetum coccineum TaxID=301880 RepID=A0ABQ4WJT4_9ASTR
MIGNESLFSTYKAYNGGYVAYGINLKGKITSKVDVVFNGAFGGVEDEEVVVGERLDEEAFVEFMVEWCKEDEDDDRNGEDDLFN